VKALLPMDFHFSFVERYIDGVELSKGLVQGLRFVVNNGRPSFRIGVRWHERADILVEITSSAARRLNSLRSTDPAYPALREQLLNSGEMQVTGDPSQMGYWLDAVHDLIVDRTS
jgi:hypothetical protein